MWLSLCDVRTALENALISIWTFCALKIMTVGHFRVAMMHLVGLITHSDQGQSHTRWMKLHVIRCWEWEPARLQVPLHYNCTCEKVWNKSSVISAHLWFSVGQTSYCFHRHVFLVFNLSLCSSSSYVINLFSLSTSYWLSLIYPSNNLLFSISELLIFLLLHTFFHSLQTTKMSRLMSPRQPAPTLKSWVNVEPNY